MSPNQDQHVALQPASAGGSLAPAPMPAGGPGPANSAEEPLFRLELARSLHLHKKLAIGVILACLTLSALYLARQWSIYLAEALIYVQPVSPDVLDRPGGSRQWPFDNNTYETFITQQTISLTRPDVLSEAVRKLGKAWQQPGENDQEAIERLERSIEVKRMGTSYQISVTARNGNAELAANMANSIANSFIEKSSRDTKSGNEDRIQTLREEKERVEKAMAEDRAEQETLNKSLGVAVASNSNNSPFIQHLSLLQDQLVKARAAHDEAAAKLTSLGADQSTNSEALNAQADELVAADAGLVSLKTSLYKQRADAMAKMANLTPSHPQYKQSVAELAQIDESIDKMTREMRAKAADRIEQKLRTDLNRTATVERSVNGQLAALTGTAISTAPRLQRSSDLEADLLRLRTRFSALDDQLHNLMVEDRAPGASHMAAAAVVPMHPDRTKVLRKAAILLIASLLLGLLAAIGANKLDQKVYLAGDVHRVLGFDPMAVLPDFDQVSLSVADEHILRLSASIEYLRQEGSLRSCIFTGATGGAGVSTVVSRVRSMLDSLGRSTVLMDASGTPPPPERPASSWNDSGSASAAAGNRSTALLQRMNNAFETREESLVLTDTAPLAHSAETQYLARFVDAAIVVIHSGVTTRKELKEAASAAQRLDVAAVGFVLNRVRLETADPDFRKSLHAVEERLRSQSRTTSRAKESVTAEAEATDATFAQFVSQSEKPALRPAPATSSPFPGVEEPVARAREAQPRQPVSSYGFKTSSKWQSRVRANAATPPAPAPPAAPPSEPAAPAQTAAASAPVPPAADLSTPPQQAPVEPLRPAADPTPITAAERPADSDRPAPARHATQPIPFVPRENAPPVNPDALDAAINPDAAQPAAAPPPARHLSWADSWKRFAPAQGQPSASTTVPPLAPAAPQTPEPFQYSYQAAYPPPPPPPPVYRQESVPPAPAAPPIWPEKQRPVASQPPAAPAPPPEPEAAPLDAAARMTGLRNLIFSLGMNAPQRPNESETETRRPAARPEPPSEPQQEQAPYRPSPAFTYDQRTPARSEPPAPPTLVTAAPEILPPKADPPADSRGSERPPSAAARRARRENVDDIDTLPSWRGQYRKNT